MGAYSALQVGIETPKRALSLTLAGVGSGFEKVRLQGFRDQAMAHAENSRKAIPTSSPRCPAWRPGGFRF